MKNEAPKAAAVARLLESAILGLGIETAAAWAEIPSDIVRNWLARGMAEEKEPTNFSKITDKAILKKERAYHADVTVPCYLLWRSWKNARSIFLMKCAKKIMTSRSWQAQAWLLERVDPSNFVRPGSPTAIKRELLHHEREIETEASKGAADDEALKEVVQIILPGNSR